MTDNFVSLDTKQKEQPIDLNTQLKYHWLFVTNKVTNESYFIVL